MPSPAQSTSLSSGLITCQSRREWVAKAGKGLSLISQVSSFCVLDTPERLAPGGTVLFPAPHPCLLVNYLLHTIS